MQIPSWRALTFLAALPCVVYPALLPSMYESPSWLLSIGRKVHSITTPRSQELLAVPVLCVVDLPLLASRYQSCSLWTIAFVYLHRLPLVTTGGFFSSAERHKAFHFLCLLAASNKMLLPCDSCVSPDTLAAATDHGTRADVGIITQTAHAYIITETAHHMVAAYQGGSQSYVYGMIGRSDCSAGCYCQCQQDTPA